ncbi:MAG TPA: nitronate monooxygenase [Hyphomicrobiaceae bacterium]|nr:nitronate monooxygenase [Hyphomicrobiaceae bacterium]
MPIVTRLTERLGITHPVILAPMAGVANGRLAAAVSGAGGLGLIGGGYGDRAWLEAELRAAGNARVGCGFITWSLNERPELMDLVLAHKPAGVFLSFGDPAPYAGRIAEAGVPLICQVQTRRDAEAALDCGASVLVAQGGEAGGHGGQRGTIAFVPEIADLIAARAPDALLCAAGGIADGRGLAAALMLGADGIVAGSRFWAAAEAAVHPGLHPAALAAGGDDTVKTSTVDIVRSRAWPERFRIRVLRNAFTERWHGREEALRCALDAEAPAFQAAMAAGDPMNGTAIVGEVVGLIDAIEPAAGIVERMVAQAEAILKSTGRYIAPS